MQNIGSVLDWLLVAGIIGLSLWGGLWVRDVGLPYLKRINGVD